MWWCGMFLTNVMKCENISITTSHTKPRQKVQKMLDCLKKSQKNHKKGGAVEFPILWLPKVSPHPIRKKWISKK